MTERGTQTRAQALPAEIRVPRQLLIDLIITLDDLKRDHLRKLEASKHILQRMLNS